MTLINNNLQIIPIVASSLNIIGYIPQLYSLSFTILYQKKNINRFELLAWPIWVFAAFLAASYAYIYQDYYIMANLVISGLLSLSVWLLQIFQPTTIILCSAINQNNSNIECIINPQENTEFKEEPPPTFPQVYTENTFGIDIQHFENDAQAKYTSSAIKIAFESDEEESIE
jgi:hypothetical protein